MIVVKPSLATFNLEPVTTRSSTESVETREKESRLVSPTTRVVVSDWDKRPLAETLILYGPPGLKPPAKYLPDEFVVLLTELFVGS